MNVHVVFDVSGPVKAFADKSDAESFVIYWKKRDRRRRVWITTMAINYGQAS